MRRLPITLRRREAMRVTRVSVRHDKLVYIIVADKKLQYPKGRSKVAYIGTTKNGVSRVAESAAYRTSKILKLRGVEEFCVRIVACRPRKHVKTWMQLERALLVTFRGMYGQVPICNSHGKSMSERSVFDYFARSRVRRVLEDLA